MSQVLNTLRKEIEGKYQKFDPNNNQHLTAYYMLRYEGKQAPNIRFFLEDPYQDVVTMMQSKIAYEFIKTRLSMV